MGRTFVQLGHSIYKTKLPAGKRKVQTSQATSQFKSGQSNITRWCYGNNVNRYILFIYKVISDIAVIL